MILTKLLISYCDAPESWQVGVQDPASPNMEGMIYFHHYLMFFIVLIGTFVFWILAKVIMSYHSEVNKVSNKFTHSSTLEIIWTILPAFVLLFISIPSFALLYSTEELNSPSLTVKIVGHQWYWSYEYSDFATIYKGESLNFDSYMIASRDLVKGSFRLLEVDNRLVLPIKVHIRLLITSADVLHSWAVPSLGVKVDACPGRLSQGSLYIKREGVFYGSCSEICGVGHGYMPIVVKAVKADIFVKWIAAKMAS